MKRIFTVILAFVALHTVAFSQSFKFVNEERYSKVIWQPQSYNDNHADVINLTAAPLGLSWKLISTTLPSGSFSICDNETCLGGDAPGRASTTKIEPGEPITFLKVQVPTELPVSGITKYLVFPTAEGEIAGLEYTFEIAESASSVSETEELSNLIAPNPVSTSFSLQGYAGSTLTISDVTGRTVYQISLNNEIETIDASKFQSGVYIIRLTSGNKSTISRFVKE